MTPRRSYNLRHLPARRPDSSTLHLSSLSNNSTLRSLIYSKTATFLENHLFLEQLERFQTHFTVEKMNAMYIGTFRLVYADKFWVHDHSRTPLHSCPAHHQFEVNLVSWRLQLSEIDLTYVGTEIVKIIVGHTLPCYFADGFFKPTTKTPLT